MNINRHNYEEFFLLYVDNELPAAARKAVDVFVQENPDLQIELTLLQQTVVKADDIVLDKKDWLFMEEDISALQENLLLYADDELTPADKKTVETLLITDKAAKTEWNILQQTKLQPDTTIVFADKQSLYRKEGGRVIGFNWRRAAAAAVLLGLGLWTGVSVYKNYNKTTTGSTELATENKTRVEQVQTGVPENNATTGSENSAKENNTTTAAENNNQAQQNESIKTAVEKNNDQNTVTPKENMTVQSNNNPGNNLPKPSLQNINTNESNETKVITVLSENNNSKRVSGNNEAVVKINAKENTNNALIINGSNSKTDPTVNALLAVNNKPADEQNNNRYLNVDDDKQKRTALGGFLRKAKRVLERTTNVNTGDGIKVAGFEIALK